MVDAPPRRPSKGELRLSLTQAWHRPGEPIRGVVHVDLRGPTSARRLVVGLVARQRSVGQQAGGLLVTFRNDVVWEHQLELDGPRRYHPREAAAFALPLPLEAAQGDACPPGPRHDEAVRALAPLAHVRRFPLEWRVYAFLDRPWHLSPRAQQVLSLTPPAPSPAPAEKGARPTRRPKSTTSRRKSPKPKGSR